MRVLFKCNANPIIGMGHLMRCRTLAKKMRQMGYECIIIGPAQEYAIGDDAYTFTGWIEQENWTSSMEESEKIFEIYEENQANFLVLDDYRIDDSYQGNLKNKEVSWLKFQSSTDKVFFANIIVNANPAARRNDYPAGENVKILVGPRYAILRPEFTNQSRPNALKHLENNIIMTFGGGGDRGAILYTLPILLSQVGSDYKINLISGKGNPNNPAIKKWVDDHQPNNVELTIEPKNMAELMQMADLAVMAGGTTTYEAASCGLPMILVAISENQIQQSIAWEEVGAAFYIGSLNEDCKRKFEYAIAKLLDEEFAKSMGAKGKKMVDGYGVERVAKEIDKVVKESW